MAQRRMIARKITQNKKLAQLKSPWAKLMYTWMIPHTDDYGRLPGDAELLKALIFPREHKSLRKIEELRDDLEGIGLIKIYEVDGSKYIQLLGFDNYQTFKSDRPRQKECPEVPSGNQMETKGNQVEPQVKLSKVKLSKDKISKKKEKEKKPPLSDEDFLKALKNNLAYKHIDIDIELAKMDAWLLTPQGQRRKKTRRFIINWLNRIDKPLMPEKKKSIVGRGGEPVSTKEALKKMGYKVEDK